MRNLFVGVGFSLTVSGCLILTVSGLSAQTAPSCAYTSSNSEVAGAPVLQPKPATKGRARANKATASVKLATQQNRKEAASQDSQPSVDLSWDASSSANVIGYNIYRQDGQTTPQELNQSPIPATDCTDTAVETGATYSYWATAVNNLGQESAASNIAIVTVDTGN